jgi:hypothetical protein
MEYSSLLFPPFPVDAIEGCRDLTCLSREQGLRAKHRLVSERVPHVPQAGGVRVGPDDIAIRALHPREHDPGRNTHKMN